MKTQPIRLDSGKQSRGLSVHTVALAAFKLFRKTSSKAACIPGAMQSCARDIATAWADSRPKA